MVTHMCVPVSLVTKHHFVHQKCVVDNETPPRKIYVTQQIKLKKIYIDKASVKPCSKKHKISQSVVLLTVHIFL